MKACTDKTENYGIRQVIKYLYSRSSMTPCQQMDEPCSILAHSLRLSPQNFLRPLMAKIPARLPELQVKNFPN